MRQVIPFLFGISLLVIPQGGVMADETKTQTFTRPNEQLLSRGAHYQAWTSRGNQALADGNHDRAIALYDQAIAIDQDRPLAWEQRGDALAQQGQYQAAIEAYNEALNLSQQQRTQLKEKIAGIQEKRAQQFQ